MTFGKVPLMPKAVLDVIVSLLLREAEKVKSGVSNFFGVENVVVDSFISRASTVVDKSVRPCDDSSQVME